MLNQNYVFIEGTSKLDAELIKQHYEVIDVEEEKAGAVFELYDNHSAIDPREILSSLFPDRVICVDWNNDVGELHFDSILHDQEYTEKMVVIENDDNDDDYVDVRIIVTKEGKPLTEFFYSCFSREQVEEYFEL